ncbi:MAG: hypothetical protein IJF74_00500, partial [Clostridia bacterium]|nr:hypothetical protein [Clostridia bacterium]
EDSFSVISANVSGLPAFVSKYDRDVPESQKTLGALLNERGFDIVCVQEDYGYHSVFAAEMTNYPYQTHTTGAVPIGDGLNIFSVYPIYNVERVAWKKSNGVFSDGSDSLSPKGFIHCTVDINGVLIELYNVHMDAYRTDPDQLAKKAQLEQLSAYINKHSKERPVLIVGDTNLTFHTDPLAEMYRILIEEGKFTDCWIEVKNRGNYMQGADGAALISKWYASYGGHDWGRWDSVERVLYRNGDGLAFKPTRFEYVIYSDDPSDVKALTDHRMMECILSIDTSSYVRPAATELKNIQKSSVFVKFFRDAAMLIRFVGIVSAAGIAYIAEKYPVIPIVVAVLIVLLIFVRRHLKKRRKTRAFTDPGK